MREGSDGAVREQPTAPVALLRDAESGLPFLAPAFVERVNGASALGLGRLEEALAHAPLDEAKKGARARYLIAALDEGSTSVDFEGDHAHDVRVAIVDLASTSDMLRVRRRADPGIVSAARRAKYSVDVDGCALAVEVREWVGQAAGRP